MGWLEGHGFALQAKAMAKTAIKFRTGTNVANPINGDDIIGDAEQIQLTNMRASAVELRARGKELHCTGEHICKLNLQGIADYRSLSIEFST